MNESVVTAFRIGNPILGLEASQQFREPFRQRRRKEIGVVGFKGAMEGFEGLRSGLGEISRPFAYAGHGNAPQLAGYSGKRVSLRPD